jgi:hypothetical protein
MTTLEKYDFTENGREYAFITDNGIIYSVRLLKGTHYFRNIEPFIPVYELSIAVKNGHSTLFAPTDKRVQLTIMAILKDFFSININSLLYICDNNDGRHHARKRKFDAWFVQKDDPFFEKYDIDFSVEDFEILASLIVHSQNPHKTELINMFLEQPKEYGKDL